MRGGELRALIDGRGVFEHRGLPDGAGCVGLFIFGRASVRAVRIDGERAPGGGWVDSVEQPTNWFHPVDDARHGGWQKPHTLLRAGSGELVLTYDAGRRGSAGTTSNLIARSVDDGRTWGEPEVTGTVDADPWTVRGTLHRFPDGRVRRLSMDGDGAFALAEASDDIRAIGPRRALDLGPVPDGMQALHMGPQVFANLDDGTVVMFLYGSHESGSGPELIHTWGAVHCRAFTCRSTDNGATWSPLVNIDHAVDGRGEPVDGSLDLTEVCGAEASAGSMVALIRPIYSPWMWETWSRDRGLTWSPCMRGPFPGYAAPNMLKTSSGALLVAHRLPLMTVHASFDRGMSWSGFDHRQLDLGHGLDARGASRPGAVRVLRQLRVEDARAVHPRLGRRADAGPPRRDRLTDGRRRRPGMAVMTIRSSGAGPQGAPGRYPSRSRSVTLETTSLYSPSATPGSVEVLSRPPSTSSATPVRKDDSSARKNMMALTTSSSVGLRPSGMSAAVAARISAGAAPVVRCL